MLLLRILHLKCVTYKETLIIFAVLHLFLLLVEHVPDEADGRTEVLLLVPLVLSEPAHNLAGAVHHCNTYFGK